MERESSHSQEVLSVATDFEASSKKELQDLKRSLLSRSSRAQSHRKGTHTFIHSGFSIASPSISGPLCPPLIQSCQE